MSKVSKKIFGVHEGKEIFLFTLLNTKGNYVSVINYGATVISWEVNGKNIVAGFDNLKDYITNTVYLGSIVGRYANRIANGKFSINGSLYTLACNNDNNHLHGGEKGFDKLVWEAEIKESPNPKLSLQYLSKDGEDGYPGNLNVWVKYTYTDDDELVIEYFAETDKATPVNLTSHCYFNLTGNLSKSITDHSLQVNAGYYTPVNANQIPTGEIRPVNETAFDFRKLIPIEKNIKNVEGGYDHNFVLNKERDFSPAALLVAPENELQLAVYTTEPGLQLYTGNFLDGSLKNRDDKPIGKHAALCLETQHYPDSPNQPGFPTTILLPGNKFYSKTVYKVIYP
jgi:aldose 1-epimerase